MFDLFDAAGNFFPTTIHVLQSAVVKIAQQTKIPEGLVLYRGLSVNLPLRFYKADEHGCKGYAEWGFMSTTAKREIAVMYSGVKKGQPTATVLRIKTSAVNRPACIEMFSQYSHEREYLWVPLSYMEPEGVPMAEASQHGLLQTIDVGVFSNGMATTTDELLGRKRQLHLKAFEGLLGQLRRDMLHEAAERAAPDMSKAREAIDQVIKDVTEVLQRHRGTDEDKYTSASDFRGLNEDMVDACTFGLSKFLLWLEGGSDAAACLNWNLRTCHRLLIALRRRRLASIEGYERAKACADLCRLMGLARRHVTELNEVGESLLMQAAADDLSPNCLRLLIQAGCSLNFATPQGVSAMYRAAQCGNLECLQVLLEARCDVDARHITGSTPLFIAAQNGHTPCARALIAARARVNAVGTEGATAIYIAAQGGYADCVEALLKARADANMPTRKGTTPVYYAARRGWSECVRLLVAAGADLGVRFEGLTALDIAARQGHSACVALLEGGQTGGPVQEEGPAPQEGGQAAKSARRGRRRR